MAGYWPSSFLRVHGPRRSRGPLTRKKRTRPICSHFDRTSLVNKGFIIWLSKSVFAGHGGKPRAGKVTQSCPLGQPITAQDFSHLARSRSQPYNKLNSG